MRPSNSYYNQIIGMTTHLELRVNEIQMDLGYFTEASESYTEFKQPTCRGTETDLVNDYHSNSVKSRGRMFSAK